MMPRRAGILLHISSLPSRFGIGDLGPDSYAFADFLEKAGQTYWQILPISPIEESSGNSPYSGHSAFAGNILLISPDLLVTEGLLNTKELPEKVRNTAEVNYKEARDIKLRLLEKGWETFGLQPNHQLRVDFEKFCKEEASWLQDYSLYAALKNHYDHKGWMYWPAEVKVRKADAISQLSRELEESIQKEKFFQFIFYRQWFRLKKYCNQKGIQIFGDIPFYVGYDSADVWAHPNLFKMDKDLNPTVVSGVPPDYFSKTGQLWGTPVFDIRNQAKAVNQWWIDRIKHSLRIYDLLRLDHFRAFSAYWEVPAEDDTAMNGHWEKGPGADLFNRLKKEMPNLPLVAEDLGEIDQPVRDLMEQFELPGMRILQFAFGDDPGENLYTPHNHIDHCLVYSGTHDNNTVRGWYQQASAKEKRNLSQYTGRRIQSHKVHEVFIQLTLSSVANTAVIPMQDYLGLGEEALMNRPSVAQGNWKWRMKDNEANPQLSKTLLHWVKLYGRVNKKEPATKK